MQGVSGVKRSPTGLPRLSNCDPIQAGVSDISGVAQPPKDTKLQVERQIIRDHFTFYLQAYIIGFNGRSLPRIISMAVFEQSQRGDSAKWTRTLLPSQFTSIYRLIGVSEWLFKLHPGISSGTCCHYSGVSNWSSPDKGTP